MNPETRVRKKDEGYTNIRIRTETREELRAIGSYSENMDDIVRKCLVAYKTITNSGGKVINKIVVEEPIGKSEQQIRQGQQRNEKSPNERIDVTGNKIFTKQELQQFYDDGALIVPGSDDYFTMLWLPGLEFPTNTRNLIGSYWNYIEKSFDKTPISSFKEKFSDKNREYKNKEELEEDLRIMLDIDKKIKGEPDRMMSLIAVLDRDKDIADQNFMNEYLRRLNDMSGGLILGKREKSQEA